MILSRRLIPTMSSHLWTTQDLSKALHCLLLRRGLHQKKKRRAFASHETVPQFFERLQLATKVSSLLQRMGWSARAQDTLLAMEVPWDAVTVVQILKHPLDLDAAWRFFQWLKSRNGYRHDAYTYTRMIDLLGQSGKLELIQTVVKDMSQDGHSMSIVTLTTVMCWYGKLGLVDAAMDVWNQIRVMGLKPNVVAYTSLIHLLLKEKRYSEVVGVYVDMVECGCRSNARTYTVLIEGLANAGKLDAALLVLNNMQLLKASPTSVTYGVLMRSFARIGDADMVMKLYEQMKASGICATENFYSILIDTLHGLGKLELVDTVIKDMNQLFGQEESPKVRPRGRFFESKMLEDDMEGALSEANQSTPSADTSSSCEGWTSAVDMRALSAVLSSWCPANVKALDNSNVKWDPAKVLRVLLGLKDADVAWNFFNWVKDQKGYKHDSFTYSKIISICMRNKRFRFVELLLEEIHKENCQINVVTCNMIIYFFAKEGRPKDALKMFFWMKDLQVEPNCKTFTLLLEMFMKTKQNEKALEIYKQMLDTGYKPDTYTYTTLIHALGASGKVHAAYSIFERMRAFGCEPSVVTYTALVDVLFRKGEHTKAMMLFEEMQERGMRPTSVTISIVAKALKGLGQTEEAEKLKQNIVSAKRHKALSHSATLVYRTILKSFGEIETDATTVFG